MPVYPLSQKRFVILQRKPALRERSGIVLLQHMQFLRSRTGPSINMAGQEKPPVFLVPVQIRQYRSGRRINPVKVIHIFSDPDGNTPESHFLIVIAVYLNIFLRKFPDAQNAVYIRYIFAKRNIFHLR